MTDSRDQFFDELRQKLNDAGIKAIVKVSEPANGKVIKLEGVALFKKLTVPNPFKSQGVAIHRRLSDTAISQIGGKRIKAKNDWVSAPLTTGNYEIMMKILFLLAEKTNASRNTSMGKARKRLKEEPIAGPYPTPLPGEVKAPKKKSKIKKKKKSELAKAIDNLASDGTIAAYKID